MSDLEHNKQVVVDYYQTAFSGNPEKAIADHFGTRYIQHNPEAQDGPEAFTSTPTRLVSGRLITWYGPSLGARHQIGLSPRPND